MSLSFSLSSSLPTSLFIVSLLLLQKGGSEKQAGVSKGNLSAVTVKHPRAIIITVQSNVYYCRGSCVYRNLRLKFLGSTHRGHEVTWTDRKYFHIWLHFHGSDSSVGIKQCFRERVKWSLSICILDLRIKLILQFTDVFKQILFPNVRKVGVIRNAFIKYCKIKINLRLEDFNPETVSLISSSNQRFASVEA